MRVVVYPHDLGVGGSQLNAIELAGETHRLGHPTVVAGRPGPLVDRIHELGLEFVELPAPSRRPSRRVAQALRDLVRERDIDIVHGYEWPPTLEACWATRGQRAVAVATVMSMSVAPFIPKSVPLLVGTEQISQGEQVFGRRAVNLLEPPVDLMANDPSLDHREQDFRHRYGVQPADLLVVVVTRLAHQLKLEGLLAAMTAVGRLRPGHPVRLMVVGGGPARVEVERAAAAVNAEFGAGSVILTGELIDPRPAYAAADITLGMGGSALRALAFGKPLIVQGERGYWRLLTPESVGEFLWAGWYGVGPGVDSGADVLHGLLSGLVDDRGQRETLGRYGRALVEDRFSLVEAAVRQLDWYSDAKTPSSSWPVLRADEVASGFRYLSYYLAKRYRRARGNQQVDDFNVRLVSVARPGRPEPDVKKSA